MIDITAIKIRELYIHRVGNLLRNEGTVCSDVAQQVSPKDLLPLTQFLFGHSDRLKPYTFTHSVDSELNAVASLTTRIALQPDTLQRASVDIAAHLYSVSNHPRVKAGNLYIGIFDDVRIDGKARSVLGLFKSDTVDDFIKVEVKNGRAVMKVDQGSALTSLDKIALVLLSSKNKPDRVLSASARGEDAVFWNERFLQLSPAHSATVDTKTYLDACRAFATQGGGSADSPDRILFLNRSLQFFETSDRYDEKSFSSVFSSKAQENEFSRFKAELEAEGKSILPKSFEIEKNVVRKERTKFEKNVKLDANIEIRLRFKSHHEMKKRVERGFDKEKGLAFYKLYFSVED